MRTIILKEVDGIKIVSGVGKLQIDSVETQKEVRKRLKKKDSFKELKLLGQKRVALRGSENKDPEKMKVLKEQIELKKEEYNKDLLEIYNQHKVFFDAAKNEETIDKEKAKEVKRALKAAKKVGKLLAYNDGSFSELEDLRGKEYYQRVDGKLELKKIEKLGESLPTDAILELSKKEKNEMSDIDLMQAEKDSALIEAALMKCKAEILGESSEKALSDAKSWYNQKILDIDAIYS